MIKKIFSPTYEKLKAINSTATFTIEVANELLNGYDVEIQKVEKGFSAKVNFKLYKDFRSSQTKCY